MLGIRGMELPLNALVSPSEVGCLILAVQRVDMS